MNKTPTNILISRTDSIGDVVLTLPLCGWLKKHFPECRIGFIGRTYTLPIINSCQHIDYILNFDELHWLPEQAQISLIKQSGADTILHVFPNKTVAKWAKEAGIKTRVGTSHRWFHWLTCNKLLNFSRKNSTLHESQLNFKLAKPFINEQIPELSVIAELTGFRCMDEASDLVKSYLSSDKTNIILHPKSKGSAREWGLANFKRLIKLLPASKFNILITGTEAEANQMSELFTEFPYLVNTCGTLSLDELIVLISKSDILIAASTGPLHIAAASGIHAIGLFPPIKPMHPGRWQPIGKKIKVFVKEIECNTCRHSGSCECMLSIDAGHVADYILKLS